MGGWGWALRKRPAIYVLVLCKYYMSSTFAQLFAITSTGWVYYFRNHALFMEQHDLLPHSLSLFLSLQKKKKRKSRLVVPAEQLQGRETQMEMFVENNMCIIKV